MSLLELAYGLFDFCVGAVGVCSVIAVSRRQTGWKREMKEYARANHFALLGKKPPAGINLRRTNLHDIEIANVMQGTLRDTDMVVFTDVEGTQWICLNCSITL